jgi:hypothetical protein
MVDTALDGAIEVENLHGPVFILGFHLAGGTGLTPLLDGFETTKPPQPKLTPYEEWWRAPVIRDGKGNEYSRQQIIETMRDQEDAHTDGELNQEYAAIAYKGSIGITQIDVNSNSFDPNPARVVARQVAHEVLRTFSPEMPPIWVNTRGLKVQPIILSDIQEKDTNGCYQIITDHKAIEFKSESTASPEVWQEWQKFIAPSQPAVDSPQKPSAHPKDYRVRFVFLNYAPYPIEGVQAMISMQDPII